MERGNIFRFISHEDLPYPASVGLFRHPHSNKHITCSGPHATALVAAVPLVAAAVEEVAA
jgi:hypothetical protein